MDIMKKFLILLLSFTFILPLMCISHIGTACAMSEEIYIVQDSMGNVIFEGMDVEVGDKIITREFLEYEVVDVDEASHTAYAEYNGRYLKPKIVEEERGLNLAPKTKSVALYMTHNDESYIAGDGYDSVYGKGGIHDIARLLKESFVSLGYDATLDETLHIPHDKSAYTRSSVTAKRLLESSPDAIFDIHRDGASRSLYVKNIDGKERCKVRIVVGSANPDSAVNLQFALYLMSVAEVYCPWLFLDIYHAKGHYNQALSPKSLLFEMGSHLVEKDLVIETVPYLAEVVDKTLFSTIDSGEGDTLIVTDDVTQEEEESMVSNILSYGKTSTTFESRGEKSVVTIACVMVAISGIIGILSVYRWRKISKKKPSSSK